jgi:hypothetical protein
MGAIMKIYFAWAIDEYRRNIVDLHHLHGTGDMRRDSRVTRRAIICDAD